MCLNETFLSYKKFHYFHLQLTWLPWILGLHTSHVFRKTVPVNTWRKTSTFKTPYQHPHNLDGLVIIRRQEPLRREVSLILHLATIRGIMPISMECIESPLGESSKPPLTSTTQSLGIFLGIIDRDPSVSKLEQLQVDIYRLFIIKLRNVSQTPLNIISSNFPEVFNFNQLFLKLNQVICTSSRFSPCVATTPPKHVHQSTSYIRTTHPQRRWKPITECLIVRGERKDKLLLKKKKMKKKIPGCWDKLINSRCMHNKLQRWLAPATT